MYIYLASPAAQDLKPMGKGHSQPNSYQSGGICYLVLNAFIHG